MTWLVRQGMAAGSLWSLATLLPGRLSTTLTLASLHVYPFLRFFAPLQIGQPQDYTQRGDPLEDAFTSVEKAVADAQKKVNGN